MADKVLVLAYGRARRELVVSDSRRLVCLIHMMPPSNDEQTETKKRPYSRTENDADNVYFFL
jgi:hypothetical protein